jgi:hypothetical protein
MVNRSMNAFGVIALLGMLAGGCASDGATGSAGTGSAPSSGATFGTEKNIERVAAGAVEDSLNACLARIPTNASAGQKMMAEETCRRDQAIRR